MVLKFRTFPDRGRGGWFVKVRTSENFLKKQNSKISQSSLKLKLEIIIDRDSNIVGSK